MPSAKLKVAGIDLVCAGESGGDMEAVVTDAATGIYRKLAIRNGRVVGTVLLGDTRGSDSLVAAVRAGDLVEDPLQALVDASLAGPADLPDTAQICDCNGVCKGDLIAALTEGGCATPREVMAVTRAGTGCGSRRPAVKEIVAFATGGLSDEPAYLCPCRKQTREQLAVQIRDEGFASVSDVATACGTGRECGACKPALASSSRRSAPTSIARSATRASSTIACTRTSSATGRSRSCRGCTAASAPPTSCAGSPTSPTGSRCPWSKSPAASASTCSASASRTCPRSGPTPDAVRPRVREGRAHGEDVRRHGFFRFGLGDAIGLGIEMEKLWEGPHMPQKASPASADAAHLAEATVKDIGCVAVEGGWQVRAGGVAGGNVREARFLRDGDVARRGAADRDDVPAVLPRDADYKERTYDFIPRIGLEKVKEVVMGADTGAALRERLRIAKAAVAVPWLERDDPSTSASPATSTPPSPSSSARRRKVSRERARARQHARRPSMYACRGR